MAMWKFTRWYYSRRRNSHWYRKNVISIYIIFLLEEQTQRVFRKINLQKWSHMEVSMRNIATNWWMFHCHLWFYCKTVGFYCISLIFLDVYIFIYPIGSMYGIYANIWCILMVNVTIYSIHGSYGNWMEKSSSHGPVTNHPSQWQPPAAPEAAPGDVFWWQFWGDISRKPWKVVPINEYICVVYNIYIHII